MQGEELDMTARTDHPGWRGILETPGRIGSYVDLFCSLCRTTPGGDVDRRFMTSAVERMLMLDGPGLSVLINRYADLRGRLSIDLAEHLRPLVDAVLIEQIRRGLDPVETPVQFLLRRDDPGLALVLTERFMDRTRRRLGRAVWSEDRRPPWTWTPERRLRVGYVCSDLKMHPVGLSIRTLLLRHDKSRFEVFLYDRTAKPDQTVAGPVALGADVTRPSVGLSSEAMQTLVEDDDIDILVDLSGAVIGSTDTVFSRPVAPVRIAMIGYPGSMGRQTIDYTVVDRAAVPLDERTGFSERLIVMPGSFLPLDDTFTVEEDLPSREALGLPGDAFVMAAFNRLDKINIETLRIWVACLNAIPRSVLWLASDDPEAESTLGALLDRAGVAGERLVVSARISVLAHARRHTLADVSLDPLGYNGGYSTALSLQCGVPVVSRPGRCFAWRMSAGLLRQAGLDDCVVDTPANYLIQVTRIAEDRDYAGSLRNKLQPSKLARALGTRRYVAALEQAFLRIANQRRRGVVPGDIIVEE